MPVRTPGATVAADDNSRLTSFWKTLPGMLTALAALITAVGGIIAILLQTGIIGDEGGSPPPSPPLVAEQTQGRSPTALPPTVLPHTSATGTGISAGTPWADAEAVMTAKDGTVARMRAETVRFCFSGGAGINLNDSLDIAFEKISRIDVLRSDVALSPGGKATLRVTLVGGSTMAGTITSGCDFFGQTEAGRYSLYPDKLLTIEFLR